MLEKIHPLFILMALTVPIFQAAQNSEQWSGDGEGENLEKKPERTRELAQVVECSLSIWEVVGLMPTFSRFYHFHPNLRLTTLHLPAYWTNWENIRHLEHSHLDACFPLWPLASSKTGLCTPYLHWVSRSINLSFTFCFFRGAVVLRDITSCSLSPRPLKLGLLCGSVLRNAGQSQEGSSQPSCQQTETVSPQGDQTIQYMGRHMESKHIKLFMSSWRHSWAWASASDPKQHITDFENCSRSPLPESTLAAGLRTLRESPNRIVRALKMERTLKPQHLEGCFVPGTWTQGKVPTKTKWAAFTIKFEWDTKSYNI